MNLTRTSHPAPPLPARPTRPAAPCCCCRRREQVHPQQRLLPRAVGQRLGQAQHEGGAGELGRAAQLARLRAGNLAGVGWGAGVGTVQELESSCICTCDGVGRVLLCPTWSGRVAHPASVPTATPAGRPLLGSTCTLTW